MESTQTNGFVYNNELESAIASFESIGLKELDNVRLLNRVDTKFVLNAKQLPTVLTKLVPHYSLLDIKGTRANTYVSRYFDTPDLHLYDLHHNGKLNRFKIRYREYVESGLCFFEIKYKSNKGRTIKQRIKIDKIVSDFGVQELELLHKTLPGVDFATYVPSIDILFKRLTMADKSFKERATIDLGLTFQKNEHSKSYEQIVIVELKQERMERQSDLVQVLKGIGVHPYKVSKYCLGILACYEGVKYNRFKKKLLKLESMDK